MLFAYFGPETVLPLTSVLAAVAGFVMMFGRQAFRLARYAASRLLRLVAPAPKAPRVAVMSRNLRRDTPARSAYHRPVHHETEVPS